MKKTKNSIEEALNYHSLKYVERYLKEHIEIFGDDEGAVQSLHLVSSSINGNKYLSGALERLVFQVVIISPFFSASKLRYSCPFAIPSIKRRLPWVYDISLSCKVFPGDEFGNEFSSSSDLLELIEVKTGELRRSLTKIFGPCAVVSVKANTKLMKMRIG